ncbi:hypothetical protein [Streptomyces melanogenes]|uniref:hypothetical protein n=1 Tax=Streptomyces melanogenes TaxID=67326 RepID=UPI00167D6D3B|nr:hypothetical protein [Streptomyces melanogenes]GGP32116.1 hypothetical protein GCM10010278_02310 [Streptomyces melanogenes]
MHPSPPLRVPVGHEAPRWSTFQALRTLVVAARTVTSTARVLESLPALLRDDTRVSVVFAYDPTSAFDNGVLELLHDSGCRVMPWGQLGEIDPDLIVSASENIDVPDGDCPVLVLPHGIGFQKFVPDSRAPRTRLSGVVPDALLEAGRAWLAVSHPDQEAQLLASHPKTAGRTLLVGDPCFDELVVSARHRDAYRAALGVGPGQRLVMVSSTWGPTSLVGREPGLPARLLAALPYDEYRVGAIVHPNVWSAHGSWQLRTAQATALDAGLLLMPPVHSWRPALVAADLVVGDHGSVTLYGAALNKPVLLAAFGSDAVPGTAGADLGRMAPRLDPAGDLRRQIEDAVQSHEPQQYAEVAGRAFSDSGQALARLRTAVYQLLQLPEPPSRPPAAPTLLPPDPASAAVTSWRVATAVAEDVGRPVVTVQRFPAAVCEDWAEGPGPYVHLACTDEERDPRLAESASVVVRARPAATAAGALGWIQDTLTRLPGSGLAATGVSGAEWLVGLRDGRVVEAAATGPALDAGLLAAAVYGCLRAGRPLDDTMVTLRVGGLRDADVVLRLRPR